jgi:hypothetical protein
MKNLIIAVALAATALTAVPAYAGNSVKLKDGKEVVMNIGYDPMDAVGIPYSADIASGNFIAGKVLMPQSASALAETDPLAPVSSAMYVDEAGNMKSAFIIAAGLDCAMRRIGIFVIPGVTDQKAGGHIILLSRRVDAAYTPNGSDTVGFDQNKFKKDAQFRRDFVRSQGMPVSYALPATNLMKEVLVGWDRYSRDKYGEFITPFTPDQVDYLAGLNPGYKFGEKFVRTASVSLSMDPISTAIGAVFYWRGSFQVSRV